jgi:glycosyltransferase involved in cell wall biosynthesis
MSGPLLSVVVPVRNAAGFLMPLAEAFARQGTDAFEVIFVDDGSTDESPALLEQIAGSGAFCARVVLRAHAGVGAARNAGLLRAAGRYVTFVDADDMIAPDYVRTLADCAARGGDLYVFRHARVVGGEAAFDNLSGREREISAEELLDAFLLNPTRFGVYDFLVCRALLAEAALAFPEGYPYYEDYDFTLRLFDAAGGARSVEKCVYCYRAAPNSAMSTYSDERIRCLELFDDARSQYLRGRVSFYARFRKWFVARLAWSVLWQASVAMDASAARAFVGQTGMRARMRMLNDYPDRRVRYSARAYRLCPGLTRLMMKARGKGRTLLRGEKGK